MAGARRPMPCFRAFVLCGRLDVVETIGAVIEEVICGVAGCARRRAADVPHTTARGWVRRFVARAARLSVAFAALAVELGAVVAAIGDARRSSALVAIGSAFEVAGTLPGWGAAGPVAVRLGGERREADRRPTRIRPISSSAGVVSCLLSPRKGRERRNDMDHDQQEAVALHRFGVIAEATNPRLTPAERGAVVRQIATRAHSLIPTAASAVTRGPRSTVGSGRGGPAGWTRCAPPSEPMPARCGRIRSCSPRRPRCAWSCPSRSAAQIASILFHRHGVWVAERTVRAQLRRAGLHREALAGRAQGVRPLRGRGAE